MPHLLTTTCFLLLCTLPATGSASEIFSDRFELDDTAPEIALYAYLVPASKDCNINNRSGITQDTTAKICYQLENRSGDKTLDQHVITDDVLGTTYQGSDTVAPNSMITVDADIPPFQMDDHETRFVEWTTQSGPLQATADYILELSYNPYIKLRTLLRPDSSGCQDGVTSSLTYTSGWLLATAAPGDSLTVCYSAWNGGETQLNRHRLTDENDSVVLDSTDTLAAQGFFTKSRAFTASSSTEVAGTWRAGFNANEDTTRSSAAAQVEVKPGPACNGTTFTTSVDYGIDLGIPGFPPPAGSSGLRLDYTVTSTLVRPNQPVTFEAHGEIVSLPAFGGDLVFGPRDDTRIIIDIPAGIEPAGISVDAVMNGNIPLNADVDTGTQTITLSTGPVSGTPATIDVEIEATPDGSVLPLEFSAPQIELDLNLELGPGFSIETLTGLPDPDAPPLFIAEECVP